MLPSSSNLSTSLTLTIISHTLSKSGPRAELAPDRVFILLKVECDVVPRTTNQNEGVENKL